MSRVRSLLLLSFVLALGCNKKPEMTPSSDTKAELREFAQAGVPEQLTVMPRERRSYARDYVGDPLVELELTAPEKDLTNSDIGLEADLSAAVDVERVADVNVDTLNVYDSIGLIDELSLRLETPLGRITIPLPGMTGEDDDLFGVGELSAYPGLGPRLSAKEELLRKYGNANSEAAVSRSLIWLAKQQKLPKSAASRRIKAGSVWNSANLGRRVSGRSRWKCIIGM